jgi:hypothetical protein
MLLLERDCPPTLVSSRHRRHVSEWLQTCSEAIAEQAQEQEAKPSKQASSSRAKVAEAALFSVLII